jgi:hypothetical protein
LDKSELHPQSLNYLTVFKTATKLRSAPIQSLYLLKGFTYSLKAAPPYFGDVSQYLTAGAHQNQTGGVCSHSNLLLQIKTPRLSLKKYCCCNSNFLNPSSSPTSRSTPARPLPSHPTLLPHQADTAATGFGKEPMPYDGGVGSGSTHCT